MKPPKSAVLAATDRKTIELLGVQIDTLSVAQLLSEIHTCIENREKSSLAYVNLHTLNIAYSLPWFRDFLNRSRLTFCDGVGIKLAAGLTGQPLKYRLTPPDFFDCIVENAARQGWSIFFLGARPSVAQQAAVRLVEKFPGLQIQTHHGYFDKAAGSRENREVVELINRFRPHILVVGFGMPMQEKWIEENLPLLNIQVAFPVGALFDYLSGELPRAPRWLTDHGLEWLARLVIEPRRLWKRYLLGNPLFFWRIFIHHFLKVPLPGD